MFEANNVNFTAAVFMILFLTLNIFTAFLSVLIVDFERVNVGRELLLSNATHQLTQEDGCLSSTILVYCLKNSKQKYLKLQNSSFLWLHNIPEQLFLYNSYNQLKNCNGLFEKLNLNFSLHKKDFLKDTFS